MLTFAIGDVHGCLAHLNALLGKIARHAAGAPHRLVFVGDYIDRGPDSAGVIARLRAEQARPGADVICLMGNHEDLMIGSLGDGSMREGWLMNGGDAALASFGAAEPDEVPADVVAWVRALPTTFEDGRRCFVHGGLRPGVARNAQTDHDRIWIREPFLSTEHDFGRYVVHGHTPRIDGVPDIRRHRLNIDTAAVYGGRLTAAVFNDERDEAVAFLSVPA